MPESNLLAGRKAGGLLLGAWLDALNSRLRRCLKRDARNLQIGHAYFMECRSRTDLDEVMRTKIIPLLSEYFYDNWLPDHYKKQWDKPEVED